MTRDAWLAHFESAPEPVQVYLLSEASGEAENAAQAKLGFDHDAWERLMSLAWDALFEKLPHDVFLARLVTLVSTHDPLDVERELSLHLLYPLADMLDWDMDARLKELGVPLEGIPTNIRISLKPMSYGAAVRRIVMEARISLLGEEAARRVRELFGSYVKRIRTIEQVREALIRSMTDGGLGWSADQIEAFITAANSLMQRVPVLSEEEYTRYLEQTSREQEVAIQERAHAEKRAAAKALQGDMTSALDQRVRKPTFSSLIDATTEEAFMLAAVQHLDEYLERRLRNVISTRLRGVRNDAQAREVLARDAKVGGLGQTLEETDRIAKVIEQVYQEKHDAIALEETSKIQGFVETQTARIQERQKGEEAEREKWYQERMASVAQGETGSVASLKALMRGVQVVGPVCDPSANVQVRVDGGVVNAGSLDGIQGSVRLMSLTDELQTMDLARFRRMAKNPEDAKKKLLQKLHTLQQESEERWIEGVKKWRESPLQAMYLAMVSQAFREARPVSELAAHDAASRLTQLTPEEMGILIELNQQLVF